MSLLWRSGRSFGRTSLAIKKLVYIKGLCEQSREFASLKHNVKKKSRNMFPRSMKNLALHILLRWKMIILRILATSLIHFSWKGCENVVFEFGNERLSADMCITSLASLFPRTSWFPNDFGSNADLHMSRFIEPAVPAKIVSSSFQFGSAG